MGGSQKSFEKNPLIHSLRFTDDALFDIEEIASGRRPSGLSHDFELCLEAGISEIMRTPLAFQQRYKNVKILFINRFPYGIHYILKSDEIIVIGIFHTSRSPKKLD